MVRPAVLLVAVLAGMPAISAEALQCRAGTRLESRDYPKGERSEWCVDETSGLKEGPERDLRPDGSVASRGENRAGKHHGIARIYDPGEVMLVEMEFDKGKVRAMRYTEYGLKTNIADPLNQRFRDEGDPAEIYVVDESTMGINFRFPDADAEKGAKKLEGFRQYFRQTSCRLFKGNDGVNTVHVRVFNATSEIPQLETMLSRRECDSALQ